MRTAGAVLMVVGLVGLVVAGVAPQRCRGLDQTTLEPNDGPLETAQDSAGRARSAVEARHPDPPGSRWSERRRFRVSMSGEPDPLPLNRIHAWEIRVSDAEGLPVDGARIEIDGGMPEHHHGLPTAPRVTAQTGPGLYRLDGVKFNMTGWWQFVVEVDAGGITDSVRFDVTVEN